MENENLKENFKIWLCQSRNHTEGTAADYIRQLNNVLDKVQLPDDFAYITNIFGICNAEEFCEVKKAIEQSANFKEANDKSSGKLKPVLDQYLDYLRLNGEGNNEMNDGTDYFEIILELLKSNGQIIFTGAPGTGKTYMAKKIAKNDEKAGIVPGNIEKYEFVQFHPSYDYSDFVEGLRPVDTGNEGSNIQFAKVDGIFKRFCRKVVEGEKEDKDKHYFFIIDEINRADLSKVFGELMYCLEKDKRGAENRIRTQYQNLKTWDVDSGEYIERDVFEEGFFIPKNVFIIGTMNDIDRSVESMDFALRRRFDWYEFKVTKEVLISAFESKDDKGNIYGTCISNNSSSLAKSIMQLNEKGIKENGQRFGLNEQYYISQGHFTNLDKKFNSEDAKLSDLKQYVWDYRLELLLREYLRGEEPGEVKSFIYDCREIFLGENSTDSNENKEPSNTAENNESRE